MKVESARKGFFDYERAWQTALSLTPNERLANWREFIKSKQVANLLEK